MRGMFVVLVAGFLCMAGAGTGAMLFMAGEVIQTTDIREIEGLDLCGNELRLSEFRGKIVLVVFWTQSDGSAVQNFIKDLEHRFEGKPFVVVGVNRDASRSFAQAFAEQQDLDYSSFYDGPNGPIALQWFALTTPTVFVVDTNGNVHDQYDGRIDQRDVERDIERLLARAAKR